MPHRTALIVDDSLTVRRILRRILTEAGFSLCEAQNGDEAYDLTLAKRPDIVISDINMPVVDGWDFLWRVRKHPTLGTQPFIFLTARSEASDRQRGLDLGADEYVTKPFSADELLGAVQRVLDRPPRRAQVRITDTASISGNLSAWSLPDLIQSLAASEKTGTLFIESGEEQATLELVDGDPRGACCRGKKGPKALRSLLTVSEGAFRFVDDRVDATQPPTLSGNALKLLIDATSINEEMEALRRELGAGPWKLNIDRDLCLWAASDATDSELEALTALSIHRALDPVVDDERVKDRVALELIRRLWNRKELQAVPSAPPQAPGAQARLILSRDLCLWAASDAPDEHVQILDALAHHRSAAQAAQHLSVDPRAVERLEAWLRSNGHLQPEGGTP